MGIEQLVKIYFEKYQKPLVINIEDVKKYDSSDPQETRKLLSLYKLRNDMYKEKYGVDNSAFKTFIQDLEIHREPMVVMHIFKFSDHMHMILTNVGLTKVISEL